VLGQWDEKAEHLAVTDNAGQKLTYVYFRTVKSASGAHGKRQIVLPITSC
jgi:hypothetical protein